MRLLMADAYRAIGLAGNISTLTVTKCDLCHWIRHSHSSIFGARCVVWGWAWMWMCFFLRVGFVYLPLWFMTVKSHGIICFERNNVLAFPISCQLETGPFSTNEIPIISSMFVFFVNAFHGRFHFFAYPTHLCTSFKCKSFEIEGIRVWTRR